METCEMELEIEPKPTTLSKLLDFDEKDVEMEEKWLMGNIETPEIDEFNKITPKPGLCAKVKTNTDEKVFINLCHHPDVIPPPPSLSVEDIINSPEELLSNFPLSLGDVHIEKDKSGNECKCFDVVINSDYFHEIYKKENIRDFVLILASTGIERQNNIVIDIGSLKILNKPYHGNMSDHCLRLRPLTNKKIILLEENISKDAIMMPEKDSSQLVPFASPKVLDYSFYQKPSTGDVSLLIFQCFIANISDKNDVKVFVSKYQLTIEDRKGKNIFSMPLKYAVFAEKSLANFSKKRLIVAMPVESGHVI